MKLTLKSFNTWYRNKLLISLALPCITWCILKVYFSDIISNLNNWSFWQGGDGFKNLFTFKNFLRNGKGLHLDNVNFPFSEHAVFLDAQPIIAIICRQLNLDEYSTAIVHFLPLASICISVTILFNVLLYFKLPIKYSVLFSLIISLLSPQLLRLNAHFALTYTCYIPLLIYIYFVPPIRLFYKSLSIFFLVLFFGFIHPYYLIIGTVFSLAYLVVLLLFKRISWSRFFLNSGIVLLGLILFKIIIHCTDSVEDRPESPYGFWAYRSTFEGVFLPYHQPFSTVVGWLKIFIREEYESKAYVGLLGIPFALFLIYKIGKNIFLKRRGLFRFLALNHEINILLLTGYLTWLFACCYPFRLGLDSWIEHLGALKQFRSMGRIGWIFYYCFTIVLAYYLVLFLKICRRKRLKYAPILVFILISLWIVDVDGYLNMIKRSYPCARPKDTLKKNKEIEVLFKNVDLKTIDAVLALPFFHVGSEHLMYESNMEFLPYYLAYHYNIPYISNIGSRTSWNQSFQTIQLLSDALIPKEFVQNFAKNKRILIIVEKNKIEKTDFWILKNSTRIDSNLTFMRNAPCTDSLNLFDIYLFSTDSFKKTIVKPTDGILIDSVKTITQYPVFYDDFDGNVAEYSELFLNKIQIEKEIELLKTSIEIKDSIPYEFSSWALIDKDQTTQPSYKIFIKDKNGNTRVEEISTDMSSHNLYKNGARRDKTFWLTSGDKELKIVVYGKAFIFNYMLKPKHIPVKVSISKSSNYLYNNFEVK